MQVETLPSLHLEDIAALLCTSVPTLEFKTRAFIMVFILEANSVSVFHIIGNFRFPRGGEAGGPAPPPKLFEEGPEYLSAPPKNIHTIILQNNASSCGSTQRIVNNIVLLQS